MRGQRDGVYDVCGARGIRRVMQGSVVACMRYMLVSLSMVGCCNGGCALTYMYH